MTARLIIALTLVACTSSSSEVVTPTGPEESAGSSTPDDPEPFAPETGAALDAPPNEPTQVVAEAAPAPVTEPAEPAAERTTETPARRPTTILAPRRSGQVRLADVRRVIRSHQGEVSACYEEGLSRDRSLTGEVKVRFLIGPAGRVEDSEAYESTLGDTIVEECITRAMLGWRFPRPRPRRSSALLTYPYSLATE